jgi:hypothetical protein
VRYQVFLSNILLVVKLVLANSFNHSYPILFVFGIEVSFSVVDGCNSDSCLY